MSSVSIKTDNDIAGMREAGRLAAEVLEMIEPLVEPGMSTGELDRICHNHIVNVQRSKKESVNMISNVLIIRLVSRISALILAT